MIKAIERYIKSNRKYLSEKDKNSEILNLVYRYLSLGISKYLARTSVTPNQVSLLSFILGLSAAILFAYGKYLYLIWGMICLQISIFLDYVDGDVARFKSMSSNYGRLVDGLIDRSIDYFVIFGITWGVYTQTHNFVVWILAFIAIAIRANITVIQSTVRAIGLSYYKEIIETGSKNMKVLKHFAFKHTTLYFLVSLAAIFNQMFLFLIVVIIYGATFYLGSVYIIGRRIKRLESKKQFKKVNK